MIDADLSLGRYIYVNIGFEELVKISNFYASEHGTSNWFVKNEVDLYRVHQLFYVSECV